MKYRYLGKSGLLVSRACLGTMTFGAQPWGCDEKEAHGIMGAFLDAGGNFFDTANVYAGGRTEEIIGSFLPQIDRDQLILASKSYFPMGSGPNSFGSSRKHIITSCENSLRRLGTDYIDIYYLHGPDPLTPMEEILETLDILVRQGKILYAACSNIFGWQIAKAMEIARHGGGPEFVCGQHLYNLVQRDVETEVIPAMLDYGMALLPYSPLGGGLLAGKYLGMETPPAGSRLEVRMAVDGPRFWHEKGFRIAEKLKTLAEDSGVPMSKLALAWPLTRSFVSSVIIGVKSRAQLEENLAACLWDIPEEVRIQLDEISAPDKDYLWASNEKNYARFSDGADFLFPGTGTIIDPR